MAKFKFRLERVMKYRELLKDQAEKELAEQNGLLRRAEQVQEQLVAEKEREKLPADNILTAADLSTLGEYESFVQYLLERQVGVVQDAEKSVEIARDALIEKAREEKALSLLRDKKLEAFHEEQKAGHKKTLSDLALRQHRSKHGTRES